MTWLEIISVRTAGATETVEALDLCRQICRSVAADQPVRVTIYSSTLYATDFSVHLRWEIDPGGKSVLGNQVSSTLSDFGLINHTLWASRDEYARRRHGSAR